ncbi:hypothetical protein [Streptomyces sp. NBC_00388]|uniref:hypothetical protein n=1 Tax=Streptomyces sp. NBC_00388 TaxID=2975735 RepID=UPI002E1C3ACD
MTSHPRHPKLMLVPRGHGNPSATPLGEVPDQARFHEPSLEILTMRIAASPVNSRLVLAASAAIAVSLAVAPVSLVSAGRDGGVGAAVAQPHSSTSSPAGGPLDSDNGFSWG